MILLTGATGFLGSYLLRELSQSGIQTKGLVRDLKKVENFSLPGVTWAEGDVMDILSLEEAMADVTHVIHTAAVVSFWNKRREEMKRVNVEGTANVVDAAKDAGVKKPVHVSSIAAIGRNRLTPVVNEKQKWSDTPDNSYYALTKHLAELEVYRGIEEGLPAVIANPGVIMGEALNGNWDSGTPKLIRMVQNGLRYHPAGGSGFVSAVDVARACIALMESDKLNGERYILVSDNISWKEMLETIARRYGKTAPSRTVPPVLARLAGIVNESLSNLTGKEPSITRETTRTSGFTWKFEGARITNDLGFVYEGLGKM